MGHAVIPMTYSRVQWRAHELSTFNNDCEDTFLVRFGVIPLTKLHNTQGKL